MRLVWVFETCLRGCFLEWTTGLLFFVCDLLCGLKFEVLCLMLLSLWVAWCLRLFFCGSLLFVGNAVCAIELEVSFTVIILVFL